MAENESSDDSQKTEEPTAKRLDEARKRGQVILSREINHWIMLFAGAMVLLATGPSTFSSLQDTMTGFIEHPELIPTDAMGLKQVLVSLCSDVGIILILPLIIFLVAAVAGPLLQVGPLLTFDPITPKLEKISPLAGFKRIFSARSLADFIKGLIKLTVIAIVGVVILTPFYAGAEHFVGLDFSQMLFETHTLLFRMVVGVLSVLAVIAVMDYVYQRHEHMKKMRMSKQEIREEYRQSEGDPQIKGRLRQLREEKARQRMMQNVPKANVVITNPTHFAVALRYETAEMDAPILVAKGADFVAEKIKEIAREHKIPIVENAPLARALFDQIDLDQTIPREHYKAVAEVISYVFKLKGRLK